ncbi:hypothetical protein LIER_32038 [Lithospermum erythrorhizon]|uniref:Auxin-responsive protein n=1 Tax=Lithospermum erythrorhizon TaxID=34254 RepID=A0AAV3RV73_LITER
MPISLNKHDNIGFSENLTTENSRKSSMVSGDFEKSGTVMNMKATELRLGLPGYESPERDDINVHGLLMVKGIVSGAKRGFSDTIHGGGSNSAKWGLSVGDGGDTKNGVLSESETLKKSLNMVKESHKPTLEKKTHNSVPSSKAQVVGWPPIRSFRKNSMAVSPSKTEEDGDDEKSGSGCLYVKVSMDGAPYLRKVDLRMFNGYKDLSTALEKMFSSFTIGQYGSQGIPSREGLSESKFKDLLRSSEFVLTFEDKDGDWMLVGDVPWQMFMDSCKRLRIMKSSDAIGLTPRGMGKCKTEN